MADSGPDLTVDLDVHLLVKLLWELKSDLIDNFSLENVFVELLDILSKSFDFGIVFKVNGPLLEAFNSETFLESITVRFYRFQDLVVFLGDVF